MRVVVQDAAGAILLLSARDSSDPTQGTWWELPGGGLEAGETLAQAAVRELNEETGIAVSPADIGPATWRRDASFRYRGRRHLQHEQVALVRIDAVAPDLATGGRQHYEVEDYPDYRWWPVAAVVASGERFYPGRLAEYLPSLLARVVVDEPLELFS